MLIAGCATNPVTGKNELMLIPESMEIQMGQENYLPSRQMQGGDYAVDPAVNTYVREIGQKLAAVSDRKLPYEFNVVNDSEVNAWMLPGGKMGINRGLLLKMDSESELAAVIGHEITHAAAKHGAKQMQQALLLQGAAIAASLAIDASTDDELVQGLGAIGVQAASVLLQSKFSRDDESQADHYGMVYMSRAGYDPQAAVAVQELLLKESEGKPDNLFTRLLSDHPPSAERVAANRAFAAQLAQGGTTGKQAYHRHLAHLFRDASAYAAYDKAGEALKAGDFGKARDLANKAIAIEPKEALFHILKGRAMEGAYQGQKALDEYRQAAHLNPGYYEVHLRLGLLLDAMGNRYQARQALENSVRLLQTAAALHRLGRYAQADGNLAQAKGYFRQAAESGSNEGKAAFADLLKLDLPGNASAYLDASLSLDGNGQLQFLIRNNTPFRVGNIVVEASDNSGSKRMGLNGVVQPNSQETFNMGVQATQQQIDNSNIVVISARLAGM
ncbi:MAG: M48 family metalloprotease [Mariprofundus sp.]